MKIPQKYGLGLRDPGACPRITTAAVTFHLNTHERRGMRSGGHRTGPKFDEAVRKMGEFLAKKPIRLADGINAQIGDRIVFTNEGQARNVRLAPTVEYVFDRTGAKSAEYAWKGLSQFGPFDRSGFANRSPRILVVYPSSTQGKVENFLSAFRDGMGSNYPAFSKGFVDLMGLTKVEFVMCPVEVSNGDRSDAHTKYNAAIEDRLAGARDVHAGIVVLFEEHARLPDDRNPYIHTKSLLLTLIVSLHPDSTFKLIDQPWRIMSIGLRKWAN